MSRGVVLGLATAGLCAVVGPPALAHTPGDFAVWSGPAPEGGVLELRLEISEGVSVSTWVQDGGTQHRLGWRPDTDPTPGRISVRWEELWLDPGNHALQAWVPGEEVPLWSQILSVQPEGSRRSAVTEHPVVGLRRHQGAHDGLAASLSRGGTAGIPGGAGTWDLATLAPVAATARVGPHTPAPPLGEPSPPLNRAARPQHLGLVRFGLLPAFALCGGLVCRLGWRARRLRGVLPATALAAVCSLLVLWPVLGSPFQRLLAAGWPISDPVDSVALLAAVAGDLPLLSGLGAAVQWPEGGNWLAAGPAALAAIFSSPLALTFGPVAGHNLGVGIGVGALAMAAWGLARVRGARPGPALVAGAAAVLAPAVWDEWDALSLDRSTLFTVPLTLLLLDLAVLRGGWRRLTAAGILVGGGLYWQVYHALFLGLALPVLTAPLLAHRAAGQRLCRLLCVAGVAGATALPGLLALTHATDAPGGSDPLQVSMSTLSEITAASGEAALAHQAAVVEAGGQDPLRMDTAQQRVLSAASRSWSLDDVIWPRGLLVGGPVFLWLLLASVLVSKNRGRAARSTWEVGVLAVCALGPVVLWRGQWTGIPGPWLVGAAFIPGFEQLKNVYRFGLLAAVLGGVPLALLLDGALRRSRAPRWLQGAAVALLLVGLGGLHFQAERRGGLRVGLPEPGRSVDPGPALPDLGGPVVLVPHGSLVPAELLLPALTAKLPVVGASPLEPGAGAPTPWRDENALLSRLAVLSADVQADRIVPGDLQTAADELISAGVAGVAVRRDLLPHESLLASVREAVAPVAREVPGAPPPWTVWRLEPREPDP